MRVVPGTSLELLEKRHSFPSRIVGAAVTHLWEAFPRKELACRVEWRDGKKRPCNVFRASRPSCPDEPQPVHLGELKSFLCYLSWKKPCPEYPACVPNSVPQLPFPQF